MARRKSRLTAGSPWPAPAAGEAPVAGGESSATADSGPAFAFGSAVAAGEPPRAPRLAFIVSHTHWDREWYLTFSRFRVRLLEIVGKVLDTLEEDGAFRHFMLDGQAAILEDYLALRPEDEGRIRALVTAGKLSIGPWYVLPDWFLVSGEAIVRNLLVGHRVCGRFGPVQKVGYMPDSFGHVAQIPQILRRVGIDSFIFTRGIGDELDALGYEFRWEAPDGSDVLAVNQHKGYDGSAALGFESYWAAHTRRTPDPALAVEQVRALFAGMAPLSRGGIVLMNNGGDHLPPQQAFGAIIAELRAAFP
jgi:mannosylglycerate hydrolase